MHASGAYLAATLLVFAFCRAQAGIAVAPEYQVGDKPASDVVTPVPLVIVDHERTEALRQKEAERVPAIFRFNTNAAAEAELKMLTAYTSAKEGFLKAIERTFKKRKLDSELVEQERFGKAVISYQKANRGFPLTTNVAMVWALGELDQPLLEDLTSALREAMEGYIRVDNWSAAARLGTQQARLVPGGSAAAAMDLDTALAQSVAVSRTNFMALSRVRKDLQSKFGPDEQWAGKFVAGFVRENCVCDEALTAESRARRTDPIIAADTYEAGTVVARAGELIDAKAKRALDELKWRAEGEAVKRQATEEKQRAEAMALELQTVQARAAKSEAQKRHLGLILAGVGAAGAGLAGIWMIRGRRQQTMALVPAGVSDHGEQAAAAVVSSPEVRERLLPDFTRWLKQRFMQRLLSSHAELSETQRMAALQVAELERRLNEINGPLKDRLQAYEQRIVELEQQLAARGAENRELLQATIKMARERLEAQRSQPGIAWN
jgi:membrane-associated HD superfamily phosphohydrolase